MGRLTLTSRVVKVALKFSSRKLFDIPLLLGDAGSVLRQ